MKEAKFPISGAVSFMFFYIEPAEVVDSPMAK